MSVVNVTMAELHEKLAKCIAGERVLIDHEGNRFSGRIQHVGLTGLKVIPEAQIKNSTGDSGDIDGVAVTYDDIWELEVKGVVYSRQIDDA
ncbi:hypothetical protein ELY33_13090 [Vreelandella andesensis]|uniref:Uncharacterized protein n=1 Tax=Vreelandella andesensis TaxID=447567 RepID=A0A433KJ61_9GAMM|nr:hypothetical protein [Halomonas andesensis]RUR29545.1 hypothetical protein ELY33_13090 [Halomonas andesensis]